MSFQVPRQQARYADPGRRDITLLGRTMPASLVRLKEADAMVFRSTHEIFVDRPNRLSPQQIQDQIINFDGDLYKVVRVVDPKASDPTMKGKYWRILCTRVAP
jgi:hypothetical protein